MGCQVRCHNHSHFPLYDGDASVRCRVARQPLFRRHPLDRSYLASRHGGRINRIRAAPTVAEMERHLAEGRRVGWPAPRGGEQQEVVTSK